MTNGTSERRRRRRRRRSVYMSTSTFLGQRESTLSLVLRLDPWGPRAPGKFIVPLRAEEGSFVVTSSAVLYDRRNGVRRFA